MMRKMYTQEMKNLAITNMAHTELDPLLEYQTTGPFWEILQDLDVSLAVSREYEHFIALLGAASGYPSISALELPHPSGLFYDESSGDLIVSSTRTPNQIFWMRQIKTGDYKNEIIPNDMDIPDGTMFLPYRSIFLPGTLYIHDLALIKNSLYATITGHNFLARLDPRGGWERVWWPNVVESLGDDAFRENCLQLNSIAVGESPSSSFYTAFSSEASGPKPWKNGYGPRGKGVVFSGETRNVLLGGLTCPHSAKLHEGSLWLCNSGYGELGFVNPKADQAHFETVAKLNGFTRGLAFQGSFAFVGLSVVIDFYEPYAPGLDPKKTQCGIGIVDVNSGETVASLIWPQGYQIYDIQVMPKVRDALLPYKPPGVDGINKVLRYIG